MLVSNEGAKAWHDKTQSQVKDMKVLSQFYHELCKEPKADTFMYTPLLEFIAKQLKTAEKFGALKFTDIVTKTETAKQEDRKKKPKWFRLVVLLYLVVGLLFMLLKKQKRLLLTWPKALLMKH